MSAGQTSKLEVLNRMLGRDVNAANIIADIFVDVRTLSDVLPLWITNDDVRKVNSQKLYMSTTINDERDHIQNYTEHQNK